VKSFGDALWWAVTTTTTVGYGDVYPRTGEGRIIAMGLMVTGIGVIGIFTATVASLFMSSGDDQLAALHKRLEEIDQKIERLLAERDRQPARDNEPV
jgi:voltage-gated potassium channel